MATQERALYTASNGDTWALARDARGELTILHRSNQASGGKSEEIDISHFLAPANQDPEHRALRRLIEELIEANNVPAEFDDHD